MFGYSGKHVVVLGGASGIGAAAAQQAIQAGARVTVLDIAEPAFAADRFIRIDLREQASVDAAVAELSGPVDCLFSCSGVANGTPGLLRINFIGQRHLIERLLDNGALGRGAAVVVISSVAGFGWQQDLDRLKALLAVPDWAGQQTWAEANDTNPDVRTESYLFSKRAVCAYVASSAHRFMNEGVRLNAILPGPTDTPLARANASVWLAHAEAYRADLSLPHLTPDEMASVMLFLGSGAASGIAGENLVIDRGQTWSAVTGSFGG